MRFPLSTKGLTVMRGFSLAAVLSVMLAAAPTSAQAPPPADPVQAPAPQAPRAVPTGTRYAFVNIQRVAAESAEGKVATAKVQALNQQRVAELGEKNKQLQVAQQKFESSGPVMSDAARAQLQKEIERLQIDLQRFTEDAQQEVTTLQNQLQEEFQRRLTPVIGQLAAEKNLHLLFSVADSGLVWADPSLDITTEVIQKFDASAKTAAPAAPTAKPAAAAPAPRPAAPAPAPKPAPAKP